MTNIKTLNIMPRQGVAVPTGKQWLAYPPTLSIEGVNVYDGMSDKFIAQASDLPAYESGYVLFNTSSNILRKMQVVEVDDFTIRNIESIDYPDIQSPAPDTQLLDVVFTGESLTAPSFVTNTGTVTFKARSRYGFSQLNITTNGEMDISGGFAMHNGVKYPFNITSAVRSYGFSTPELTNVDEDILFSVDLVRNITSGVLLGAGNVLASLFTVDRFVTGSTTFALTPNENHIDFTSYSTEYEGVNTAGVVSIPFTSVDGISSIEYPFSGNKDFLNGVPLTTVTTIPTSNDGEIMINYMYDQSGDALRAGNYTVTVNASFANVTTPVRYVWNFSIINNE